MSTEHDDRLESVLKRIQKLNRLSASPNEHEAASAAAEAARLMRAYQIDEVTLELGENRTSGVEVKAIATEGAKASYWKGRIAKALAESVGARMFWDKELCGAGKRQTKTMIVGRPADIATIRYSYESIVNQIEAACEFAWSTVSTPQRIEAAATLPRYESVSQARVHWMLDLVSKRRRTATTWKPAFLSGATDVVVRCIMQQAAASRSALADQAKYEARQHAQLGPVTALMVQTSLTKYEEEAERLVEDHAPTKRASRGQERDVHGYLSGRAAGENVSIGGGRELSAPSKQLDQKSK